MSPLVSVLIFIVYALFSSSGLIVLKMAMSEQPVRLATIFKIILSMKFILGFGLYLIGFVLWMYILSKYKLNFAFPIAISLFFILSGLGSYFILKEPLTGPQFAGIALCLFGILLIAVK